MDFYVDLPKTGLKIDKSNWKAPMKIATLAEFMSDYIEAMRDECLVSHGKNRPSYYITDIVPSM
jgi:hypothetical protein